MEFENLNKMCDWERKKAIFILGVAEDLGMNTSDYGDIAVNDTSGYTYLWIDNYNFTLYMPIDCELKKEDIYAQWTNLENGEEEEISIKDMTLKDVEDWAEEQKKSIKEED